MRRRAPREAGRSETHSDLAGLIEAEQRLAARVEAAHGQAEALRARAREDARMQERAQEDELAALLVDRSAEARERLHGEIDTLTREGETAIRRYTSLSGEETDRLARRALELIRESMGVGS
jgi:vacuolar-type H+-ATPase subunit H